MAFKRAILCAPGSLRSLSGTSDGLKVIAVFYQKILEAKRLHSLLHILVGMAMAEAHLASVFNKEEYPVVDHYTFVLGGESQTPPFASAHFL